MSTLILGIETSCDETSVAFVRDGREVVNNIVSSQIALHQPYGGVVPELAARQHMTTILPVLTEAFRTAGASWHDIAAVAVTAGPGLAGSLLVGVNAAKAIAFARDLPLIGVNHIEAHMYANWLATAEQLRTGASEPRFPALALIVSGGHTELVLMRDHGQYQLIGATRDDAAGEAFDKVGRVLGLPYPGGPSIQKAASGQLGASRPGNPKAFALPRAMLRGSDDFSFSGLKTAAQRLITEQAGGNLPSLAASPDVIADLAASVQEAIADMLVTRTLAVAERFAVPNILVAGGVSANTRLRELFRERCAMPVLVPPFAYCTDNAAMIAGNAFFKLQRGQCDALSLDVQPNLRLAPEEF